MTSLNFTLTQQELHKILHYDPQTGIFTWKVRLANRIKVQDVAGYSNPCGRIYIGIKNIVYMAHRLAWLYVYGEWPTHQIDHINRICYDNRICNLRLALDFENKQNLIASKRNKSGFRGVYWSNEKSAWVAQITLHRKTKHLGYFKTAELAYDRYLLEKSKTHLFCPTLE
jgi:hypothetical protein